MTNRHFASVWDAIEDTPAEAENMKLRSQLMLRLKDHIARAGLSKAEAAKLFGITQPRVSDLMHGKTNVFAIEALLNMAAAAGLKVEMQIRDADDTDWPVQPDHGPRRRSKTPITWTNRGIT